MSTPLDQLLALSRDLGRAERQLAILGEGNTSCRLDADTFLVKASGGSLATLSAEGVTRCRFAPLLDLLDRPSASDEQVTQVLLAARVDSAAKKPSTEAMFHAWLLTLPGVAFVAHTHPVSVNGILCSPRAAEFAARRVFPDEIVCCGRESALVPYVDPGLPLARAIRERVEALRARTGQLPRVILLQNHGLIAPGRTPEAAMAATLMCDKAARIFTAAVALGGPVFLPPAEVDRIDGREDEAYRQRELNI